MAKNPDKFASAADWKKGENRGSNNALNDGKKSLSNFSSEVRKTELKFSSNPINIEKKIEKNENNKQNYNLNNKQENILKNENLNELNTENKTANQLGNDKKNENKVGISNCVSNDIKSENKVINDLVNNINKPNIVLTNNLVSELKRSLESKLGNFANPLSKNDIKEINLKKIEIVKVNPNVISNENKRNLKKNIEFNNKFDNHPKEEKKIEESNLNKIKCKEGRKSPQKKSPEKDKRGQLKKKEEVSQQIQSNPKNEEKNKDISQRPAANRLQNLNPNFLIKKGADGETKKEIEVEIFEPKKKPIFNPDVYKIVRSPDKDKKEKVVDQSKWYYKVNLVQIIILEKINHPIQIKL
jgi:hypothetical protein